MKGALRLHIVLMDARETVLESATKDLTTFGFLGLMMYLSADYSPAWTAFFICLTVYWVLCVAGYKASRKVVLRGKTQALRWAQGLPDEWEPLKAKGEE